MSKIQEYVKLFKQPGSLAGRAAYTISVMRQAGKTDTEIIAALKALCSDDTEREIQQWQK